MSKASFLFHHLTSHASGRSSTPRPPPRKLSIILISLCVSFGLVYYFHISGGTVSLTALYSRPKYQWKPGMLVYIYDDTINSWSSQCYHSLLSQLDSLNVYFLSLCLFFSRVFIFKWTGHFSFRFKSYLEA